MVEKAPNFYYILRRYLSSFFLTSELWQILYIPFLMFSGIISFNRSKTSYDKGKLKNHSSRQEQTLPLLYFPNISNIQNIQTFKNSQAYIKVERILQ